MSRSVTLDYDKLRAPWRCIKLHQCLDCALLIPVEQEICNKCAGRGGER